MPRKTVNRKLPVMRSEAAVDRWLQGADLTDYFTGEEFQKTRFAKLEKKLVDESYEKALVTQPVTLRLPEGLIQKLKLVAADRGIPYQILARMVLQKSVNQLLTRA